MTGRRERRSEQLRADFNVKRRHWILKYETLDIAAWRLVWEEAVELVSCRQTGS